MMKHLIWHLALLTLLLTPFSSTICGELFGKTFFQFRGHTTPSRHEQKMLGVARPEQKPDTVLGSSWIDLGYQVSYNAHDLATYFFGSPHLSIKGSQVVHEDLFSLLADTFGLSPTFSSTATISPCVQSLTMHYALFLTENQWYFWLHVPAVWLKTHITIDETIISNGDDTLYPADYMATEAFRAPHSSFLQAVCEGKPFGDVAQTMFGKIKNCPQTDITLSNVVSAFGYTIVNHPYGSFGLDLRAAFPSGSRPTGAYFFEPSIGNGKHWEFGFGSNGHLRLWEQAGDQQIYFIFNTAITHLFPAQQRRFFDLTDNGFASRYLLLKVFDTHGQYTGETVPAINVTTRCCSVYSVLKADVGLFFTYQYKNTFLTLGYNGWVRGKEKISLCKKACNHTHCAAQHEKQYGVKGIANVNNNDTQSTATIYGDHFSHQATVIDATPPVFISLPQAFDLDSAAAPLLYSHTFLLHMDHARKTDGEEEENLFVSGGFEMTFTGSHKERRYPSSSSPSPLVTWGFSCTAGFLF